MIPIYFITFILSQLVPAFYMLLSHYKAFKAINSEDKADEMLENYRGQSEKVYLLHSNTTDSVDEELSIDG